MDGGDFYLVLLQDPGDLRRPLSAEAEGEDPLNDFGSFLIHDPLLPILRVFAVPVGRVRGQMLPGLALHLHHRTDLVAGVPHIEFVDDVDERGKIVLLLGKAVDAIIDGNKADVLFHKQDLGVHSYFKVVPADAAHVLYSDRGDIPRVDEIDQLLPCGP